MVSPLVCICLWHKILFFCSFSSPALFIIQSRNDRTNQCRCEILFWFERISLQLWPVSLSSISYYQTETTKKKTQKEKWPLSAQPQLIVFAVQFLFIPENVWEIRTHARNRCLHRPQYSQFGTELTAKMPILPFLFNDAPTDNDRHGFTVCFYSSSWVF